MEGEGKSPRPNDKVTYLAADNKGNLVKVTENLDGSDPQYEELKGGQGINEAARLTRERQTLHSLVHPHRDDEVGNTPHVAGSGPNLDVIREKIAQEKPPSEQ